MMARRGVVFFAYIGFDAVSTTAEEAKNPQRDLPIGIIASLVVCTVLYLAVAAILTGIVPVRRLQVPTAARSSTRRWPSRCSLIGQDWAADLVSAGAVAGITCVLLVMLMSQPRIFFAMSRDRLLPQGVSKVHPQFGTPYITTIITCVVVAIVAGLTQIQVVGEMTSIGTLFAFVVVCAAVLMLRIKRPEVDAAVPGAVRPRVPGARHRLLPLPDAEPADPHLGALPGVARPRHDHLLVLRPHPQPARRPGRGRTAHLGPGAGQLRHHRSASSPSSTSSS